MKLLRIVGAGAALAAIAVAAQAASGVVIAKSAEVKGKAAADLIRQVRHRLRHQGLASRRGRL